MSSDKLIIKDKWLSENGKELVNSFKAYMKDGLLQIFINNGRAEDGSKFAGIRLSKAQMIEIRNYLDEKLKMMLD